MQREKKKFYFTTRELIMMAAFAAVGGIASTYINMIGDLFQSFLGFAGTTQWAAGLHVVWIMMAAVIIKKPGAASTAGVLKGAVEFFSGNTHGLLVVIVDILAGILIDLIFLANRKGSFNLWFYLAAGISSVSNIIVFQLVASVPSDVLTFWIIGAASTVAFVSGVVFAGLLVRAIYKAVQKAGLIPIEVMKQNHKKTRGLAIFTIALTSIFALSWMYIGQQGNDQGIKVSGHVSNPFVISLDDLTTGMVEITTSLNDVERNYQGVRIEDFITMAQPINDKGLLLIKATDGYSFFVPMEEVYANRNLILTTQRVGKTNIVNVVGANSQKAWIRGVSEMIVTEMSPGIKILGKINNTFTFYPLDWQQNMDSFTINTEAGPKKLQGVPLQKVIAKSDPENSRYQIEVFSADNDHFSISSQELKQQEDAVRIFVMSTNSDIHFLLGNDIGDVLLDNISKIEIN